MKKILVLDFSPRKKGNSAALCRIMAEAIEASGNEAVSYAIRDIDVRPCKACAACKKKDIAYCAQKDDFTAMMPLLDECDGIVFAAPVYFGHVPGPAKCFVDRLYAFYNPMISHPLFTVKASKKLAAVMPCGGGDPADYEAIAQWVGGSFGTVGVTETKSLIENGLNDLWNDEDTQRKELAEKAKKLAAWIVE